MRLAAIRKSQNRGAISEGMPDAVSWGVEPGGEAMYRWLVGIFKKGTDTPLPDSAQYLMDTYGITAEQAGDGAPDVVWLLREQRGEARVRPAQPAQSLRSCARASQVPSLSSR